MTVKANDFVKKLATTKTSNTLFNPYNEFSKLMDDRTAPGVRQQNLRIYLDAHIKLNTKMLWVYLAPTYLEAKRSGVPLTNSALFGQVEEILSTSKHFEKAAKSKRRPNNTMLSSSLWNVADKLNINPLVWPLMPFYAHKKGDLKSRRKPTIQEIEKHKRFLLKIINIYKPKTILAVGKNAKETLDSLGIKTQYIAHPRRSKENFKKNISKYI
jgi:hypothetical protein